MQTVGGHSMLLNTKALEWAGIDAAYAKKVGYDMVHVDANGEPDGYICEKPVVELMPKLPTTMEDAKNYLLAWQDMAFKHKGTVLCVQETHRDGSLVFNTPAQHPRLRLSVS